MVGATALVAISGGQHSIFAVLLLGLLSMVLAHALVVEIQRQARRRSQTVWYRTDTVNTVLLACWALMAGALGAAPFTPRPVNGLCGLLAVGYTAASAYFVVERRRSLSSPPAPVSGSATPSESGPPDGSAAAAASECTPLADSASA